MLSIQERLNLLTEPHEGSLWQWACMMRTAIPGIVQSFDVERQTCTVQIAIQELVLQPPPATAQAPNTGTGQNIPVSVTIKAVEDVIPIMPSGGGFIMTFPIKKGDECLLVFADACVDGWWDTGNVSAQYDRRRHDISDAFAVFGPWSQPNTIPSYSTTNLEIRSLARDIVISMGAGIITLAGPTVQVIPGPTGTPLPLMTKAWFDWFTTHIYPFLTGLGYAGPVEPVTSVTTVLVSE